MFREDPVYTPTQSELDALMTPQKLLDLMPVEDNMVLGFEADHRGLGLHMAPLEFDPDEPAATALFGFRAPETWDAVGVAVTGHLRRIDPMGPDEVLHTNSGASLVMHRDGRRASRLTVDGVEVDPAELSADPGERTSLASGGAIHPLEIAAAGPEGFLSDGLARVLGLPSPGDEPPTELLTLFVWATVVSGHLGVGDRVDRAHLVALHPGADSTGPNRGLVSAEALIDTTVAASREFTWERLRRLATRSGGVLRSLAPETAEWMDATMYARWTLGGLVSPIETLGQLRGHDPIAAALFSDVIDGVTARW